MVFAPITRAPLRAPLRSVFSPTASSKGVSALFANGEQGLAYWFDNWNTGPVTLFQDANGTTPVTALEQPVGFIVDQKFNGGARSTTEMVNGGFATPATYDTVTTALSPNSFSQTAGTNPSRSYVAIPTVANRTYEVSYRLVNPGGAGSFTCFARDGTNPNGGTLISSTAGIVAGSTYRLTFTALSASTMLLYVAGTAVSTVVDGISQRELPGNHAIQPSSTSRAVLSARINVLNNSQWGGGGAIPTGWSQPAGSGTTGPNGTVDGNVIYRFLAAGAERPLFSTSSISMGANDVCTSSVYVHSIPVSAGLLALRDVLGFGNSPVGATVAWFIDGAPASSNTVVPPNCRISAVVTATGTAGALVPRYGLGQVGATPGDIEMSRPQAVLSRNPERYQRVNVDIYTVAASYDAVGFPVGLRHDGVDDGYYTTGSVDFTGSDKLTAWAGIRKLSEASPNLIVETSAISNSNAGSFAMFAPAGAGATNASFRSGGTTPGVTTSPAWAASPVSGVLTGQADIAAPSVSLRINGGGGSANPSSQGTGNYASYPLYVGRRNNATLPFTGLMYSLIVRAAKSSDAEIALGETFTNQRTQAF